MNDPSEYKIYYQNAYSEYKELYGINILLAWICYCQRQVIKNVGLEKYTLTNILVRVKLEFFKASKL